MSDERRDPPWSSPTYAVRAPLARWLQTEARALHDRLACEISAHDIEQELIGMRASVSNAFLRYLRAVFNFGVRRGWSLEKFAERVAMSGKHLGEVERGNIKVDVRLLTKVANLFGVDVADLPRRIVDDCSPERLATLLHEQGGRMAALSPEGDLFDLMAGRYAANGMPNFGVFLKGHAGEVPSRCSTAVKSCSLKRGRLAP